MAGAKLLDQYGKPFHIERRPPAPSRFQGKFDAAETNDGNYRHWAAADNLSARSANSPEVRKKLRERSRYEVKNDPNAKALVETFAHDLIGTGPRLQLTLPVAGPDSPDTETDAARRIEQLFAAWCRDRVVDLPEKLRLMAESDVRDGEIFGILTSNDAVAGPVKLDLKLIETEQCATPTMLVPDPRHIDGIDFDAQGNPAGYHFLKQHPGDQFFLANFDTDRVAAEFVIHWFRPSRVGEARGVPRLTPALPTLAQVRRYENAILRKAEISALITGIMETTLAPDDGGAVEVEAYDKIPMEAGSLLSTPQGWTAKEFGSAMPPIDHDQYVAGRYAKCGRSINAPRNIATGDSSPYNYSSGRLDHLPYRQALRVERNRLKSRALDRLFFAWFNEAQNYDRVFPGYLPAGLPPVSEWVWSWQYDGFPSIDPVKDATAAEINLRNGLTSHGDELAEAGADWEEHFQFLSRQRKRARELDIEDLLWPKRTTATTTPADQTAVDETPPARPAPSKNGQPRNQWEEDTALA